jgi:hypothetical protein
MNILTHIIPMIGGGILVPLFIGSFVLAATQSLYNHFINSKSDWGKNMSRWSYFAVAWITGASTMLILFFIFVR